MRRADAFLTLTVGALALFVGRQVAHRPATPTPAATPTDSAQVVRIGQATRPSDITLQASPRPVSVAPPTLSAQELQARIDAAPGTYMADMLADAKGVVVRWPDRRERGLRVWVQSMSPVRDWDLRYAQMARTAFADWDAGGLPMRLDFVLDSASSDVTIVWTDQFAPELGARVGVTTRTNDSNGWLVAARITVAVHDSAGRVIEPADLAGIVRHEAGHALGLGHSRDAANKMFPVERSNEISPADRATLRLLYTLPPTPMR